ncbi:MAG TPA: DNA repair protein RecO [Candidatus Hydrogenedentes bacterium]|nr:DNA repair protein RecO [Candidatus Hydrogenedentota bacterium]
MHPVREEGIVLRRVDYGDSSAIVTVLTRNHGLVACMARGMRRGGGSLSGVLDTLNRVECLFTFRDSRSVQTLTGATLLDWRRALRADPIRMACAAVLGEAALALGEAGETEALHDELENGLNDLAERGASELPAATALWLWRLIGTAGITPVLDCCADTGAPPEQARCLDMETGLSQGNQGLPLDPETAVALAALARGETGIGPETGMACLRALAWYAGAHVNRDLGAVRVLAQMLAPGRRT